MTAAHKALLRFNGFAEHVEEFGDCTGIVIGTMSGRPDDDIYNVRWQPSNLRYAYVETDLEPAAEERP